MIDQTAPAGAAAFGASSGTDSNDANQESHGRSHRCGARYRWSALEIGAVVGGFVVFWPLGVLALALKMANGEMWRGSSQSAPPWAAWKGQDWKNQGWSNCASGWSGMKRGFSRAFDGASASGPSSGNAAFDEYRRQQLERLEAERRKLDEERQAFAEHLDRLRRAKDQDEFDRFMAERRNPAQGSAEGGQRDEGQGPAAGI